MEQQRASDRAKTKAEHCAHFMQRLHERYDIEFDPNKYDELINGFKGVFKKSHHRTVGYTEVGGVTVWCLYYDRAECLATCYSVEMIADPLQLLRVCFGRVLYPVALMVYETYLKEYEAVFVWSFPTVKEAAIFYFKTGRCLFPTLHIERYKHGAVDNFKVMFQIRRVLQGNSDYITLKVVRKENKYEKLLE